MRDILRGANEAAPSTPDQHLHEPAVIVPGQARHVAGRQESEVIPRHSGD
jgi:hypothetical protein